MVTGIGATGGGQDEVSIRIGLTVAGAQTTKDEAETVVVKTDKAKREIREVEVRADKADARLRSMSRMLTREMARYAIAAAAAEGFNALIPIEDQNAYSGLKTFAVNAGTYSIMLRSVRGGFAVGGILTAIEETRRLVDILKDQVEADHQSFEQLRQRTESVIKRMEQGFKALESTREEAVGRERDRLYKELREGWGGAE